MPESLAESAQPTGGARGWPVAARLLERWRARQERVDVLLEGLPADLSRLERARVQALLFGAVRHRGRIDAHLEQFLARPPRTIVWACLLLAGYELIEGGEDGHAARVGHHAVEQARRLASPKEAGLVNAVVRRLAQALAAERPPTPEEGPEAWARYHSHPLWLVQRWWENFGATGAQSLLQHNQAPASVYVRDRGMGQPTAETEPWLMPVPAAPDYFSVQRGAWDKAEAGLAEGRLVVQDPATRHALELLAVQPNETVLDLCAAPGGKSLAIADRLKQGRVVSVDLPGARMERLRQNLAKAPPPVATLALAGDLRRAGSRLFAGTDAPTEYDAVLIDVPCSNTGVMRHRVDVKWRLQPSDLRKHAAQQFELLQAAASLVAPGGRLVYSTCSLEPEENEQVVEAFVRRSRGAFVRAADRFSRPWETGHDGAAAFRLERRS